MIIGLLSFSLLPVLLGKAFHPHDFIIAFIFLTSSFGFIAFRRFQEISGYERAAVDFHKGKDFSQALLAAIPFAIDIVDEKGNILFLNEKLAKALPKDALGKKCWDLYKDDKTQCAICPLKKGVKPGEVAVIETDGCFGGKALQVTHSGMVYGGKRAILEIFQDISERSVVDKLKDEFISTVSHELRTPLSITKEGISLVLDGVAGELNQKQAKILGTSQDNIDRLARIISALLDLSKIEAGKFKLKKEPMNIIALARGAAENFQLRVKDKQLQLNMDFPEQEIKLNIDKDRMFLVFFNLIDNAVKFTEKGQIDLSIVDKGKEVEFSILDTGKGIDRENLPSLFGKFQQFGRIVGGAGAKGTGVGLAITKGIIEMHKGKIWAESHLGEGTKISFILPKD